MNNDRRNFLKAVVPTTIAVAATLAGCAGPRAIKGPAASHTITGDEEFVFPADDMKHTLALEGRLGWDSPAAAASRRAYPGNSRMEETMKSIDGNSSAVSKLDYLVNKAISGIGQLPENVIPRVPVTDKTNPDYIWSHVDPAVIRSIFKNKPTEEFGGCALYLPGTARFSEGKPSMDIAFAPPSNNPLLRARFEGLEGALEKYLDGKEFDNVRSFNILQRGKIFQKGNWLGNRQHIANMETYTFADVPGVVTLKRDLTQNGFNVSPIYLGPETLEVVEKLSKDGKPVPEEDVAQIAYVNREKYQATRHLESLAIVGAAGAFMAGTPIGWILTAGVGYNMLRRNMDFDNVTDYLHETLLRNPKEFGDAELSDFVNPNVNSYYDGPKVITPVFNPENQQPVGLAVYSFAQPGQHQSYFEPDGSLTVTEPHKRALWTAGNVIQTAIVVGSYLWGKKEYDDNKKDCPTCPEGVQGGENPHVPIDGGENGIPPMGGLEKTHIPFEVIEPRPYIPIEGGETMHTPFS